MLGPGKHRERPPVLIWSFLPAPHHRHLASRPGSSGLLATRLCLPTRGITHMQQVFREDAGSTRVAHSCLGSRVGMEENGSGWQPRAGVCKGCEMHLAREWLFPLKGFWFLDGFTSIKISWLLLQRKNRHAITNRVNDPSHIARASVGRF